MASLAKSSPPPPPAVPALGYRANVFSAVMFVVMICAMLIPTPNPSPLMGLVRHTTIMTICATVLPIQVAAVVLYSTNKTRELGYICVPLGLTSGAVTLAYMLSQRMPLPTI